MGTPETGRAWPCEKCSVVIEQSVQPKPEMLRFRA